MTLSRRDFVFATTVLSVNSQPILAKNKPSTMQTKTQIAITYDLEFSRHFPKRGMTLGDFQKGILDSATKSYTLAAGKIAAQRGVRLRFLRQPRVRCVTRFPKNRRHTACVAIRLCHRHVCLLDHGWIRELAPRL